MKAIDTQTGVGERRNSKTIGGVIVGTLAGLANSASPLVDFAGNESAAPVPALSIVPLREEDAGARVVLMFEEGDPARPIVIGLVNRHQPTPRWNITADKNRIVLAADQEIVLRCGEASITLTRAGKVLIRGAYILTRSSGVNRIKGGSVQIN